MHHLDLIVIGNVPGQRAATQAAKLRKHVAIYPTLAECYKVAALDGFNKPRELAPARAVSPASTVGALGLPDSYRGKDAPNELGTAMAKAGVDV